MKLLVKNALIKDPNSSHFESKKDILINGGEIVKIASKIDETVKQTIDLSGKWVTPSFIDLSVNFNDPGNEHKEDIFTGLAQAKASGFSQVCTLPNTDPITDTKGQVEYQLSRSKMDIPDILPYGSVSIGAKGELMSEMMDLHHAGAVAFTDGDKPIMNSEVLFKSLQYVQKFDGLIINRPCDPHLSAYGQMHEGVLSTQLGMKGIPALAEVLMIQRDLSILEYAGGKLHFSCISSAESVELIKEAKKKGLKVTCDVAIHNLVWTDQVLSTFDTNYKVFPPLRSDKDRKALINGLKTGVIDAIVSDHHPQDEENKKLEFDLSEFGMSSLQTVFSNLIKIQKELPFDTAVKALTHQPRSILGLQGNIIEEGETASLSFFDDKSEWELNSTSNLSKSENSPYINQSLAGKCMGIFHDDQLFLNQ